MADRAHHRAPGARARWQELSLLSSHFLDVVRGLPTLRAFNRGEAQAERIDQVGERYRKATMETLRLAFLSGAVLDLAATLGVALIAVTGGGVRLVDGDIGFEPALTVLLLAPELYCPLRNLASQFHAGADGMAVAGRLLDAATATAAPVAAPSPIPAAATVRFDGVSFRYPRAGRATFEQVGLELAPGETVALVGPSGSGKSTIARLLLRLAEPSDGRILVGGTDIAACDPELWRRGIAWLPQHPTLLHGSIADNIRLGAPEARTSSCVTPPRQPVPPSSSRSCRPDTRRRWETVADRCRPERRSGSHWPGRCSATRRC